jgi:hypothetical protein
MGAVEVTQFLNSLAVQGNVAASTQNQALSALLFLYRHVLQVELPWLDDIVRAKRSERLPVVLTREEVRAVIGQLQGPSRLMAILLYGAGPLGVCPSRGSTRMPAANGPGSGCSQPRVSMWTRRQVSDAAITCTNPCCSALSKRL